MPTYLYRCTKCNHEFEEFQSITASPITFCPECDGRVERVITGGAGLLFKGNGFYITDYRNEKYKSDAKKDLHSSSSSSTPSKIPDNSKPADKK
ncbi:MAG: FmdB family zinc ribbon protein [bacterium]